MLSGGWLVPRWKAWLARASHGGGGLSSELAPVASPESGRTLGSPDTVALTLQGPAPSRPARVPLRCSLCLPATGASHGAGRGTVRHHCGYKLRAYLSLSAEMVMKQRFDR